MRDVELLAPVGSFEALKAAVQNGANAVYLGGKDFGARASANNFDRDELKEAVKYAHIRGVQVFVTTNTLRKENEIEDFLEYAKFLYDIDVDAIILQDIGMARLIKRELPDFELHASTQMVAHSLEDVKYLESVGFDRVVLAREVTVEEIKYICDNCKADIEVFVHGALCVCYSGQCLMSSMIGNRSGNRGRCAQPCRQRYELIDVYTGEVVNSNGDYLLSPRDLNAIEEIDKVIDAGVHSLKIEGRMKRPEYVATVIDGYRKTIDEYLATNKLNVSDETINDLYTIFNRKFTKGLLLGDVGKDMMNSQLPNNQGLYVGTVVDYNKKAKRLKIKLANTLKKGDGINLGGGTIGRIIKNGNIETIGYKGETIELDFVGEARKGQIVFKTSDSELMDRVQATFTQDKEFVKNIIDAKITIKLGQKPILTLKDRHSNEATIEGDKIVEEAMKVALSKEKVETQLRKLGNTPYELDLLEIELDDNVSLPISLLNQMRRDCIELLDKERVSIKNRKYKNKIVKYKPVLYNRNKQQEISVKVKNLEQLESALECGVDRIYYEDTNTIDYDEVRRIALECKPKLILAGASAYPRIIDFKKFADIASEVGAYFMVDMAHIAGLVAAGCHPSPMPYADVVTTTTHKTLRGPRGGLILTNNEEIAVKINKAIFPGIQGGPLMHTIAAKAVCFKEALDPSFKTYAEQVVKNASVLADTLMAEGFKLVSGGTDNHLMLVNLTDTGVTGKEAEKMLDEVGITVNKNAIPFDTKSPFVTSGIRIGTPASTSRGFKEEDMVEVGKLIAMTIKDFENNKEEVKTRVKALCDKYPLYR